MFNIKGVNNGIIFSYSDIEYKIPSKLFPLSNESETQIFTNDNTAEIEESKVIEVIDSVYIKEGHCYLNSENMYIALEEAGYSPFYFSGWMFYGQGMPIHHAWVGMQSGSSIHIIDSASLKVLDLVSRDFSSATDGKSREEAREIMVERIVEIENKRKLNHEKIVTGRAVLGSLYIGSIDTPDNARKMYQKAINTIEIHPSYAKEGMNAHEMSKSQEMRIDKKYDHGF